MKLMASVQRDLRRRNILRRWPRFRWDSFGRPRLQVWTTSFLGLGLGLFALFPSIFLELYLRGEKLESLPFSVFVSTPGGRDALCVIILFGAWITDRLFEAQTKPDARPAAWLRILRFLVLTIPSLGVLMSLALYKAMEESPRTGRREPGHSPLALENPSRSPRASLLRRFDHFLLASSQRLSMCALWVSLFHALPLFAAIQWLGRNAMAGSASRMSVLILCILLRIGAVGAFLVFAKERHRELQLSRRQTATVFLVLMATLLPLPFSLAGLLAVLYLSSSRFFVPEATSFATIYKKHFAGRALLDVTPYPLVTEIYGETERRRSRFYALKTALLAFEITALAWLLAPWSGVAPLSPAAWERIAVLSSFAAIPGILLWMVRSAARAGWRRPRLGALETVPHCTFHALVPLVVILAFVGGSLAGFGYREDFAGFLDILRMESLCIGILIGSLRVLTSLLTRAPTPWLTAMVVGTTLSYCFLVVGTIVEIPVPGSRLLLVGRDLCVPILFASPLAGLAFSHWLLRPFRLRHLFDRRVSGRIRAVLAAFVIPAILPLGGLAVPVWIFLRHVLGGELDREAARLRGFD